MQKTADSPWYVDWQDRKHASVFDGRHTLTDWQLVKNYESFNDVRLLSERFERSRFAALLEVGCATGEFYRYLRLQFPKIRYRGVDISQSAIDRALGKYPGAAFSLIRPDASLREALSESGAASPPEIVYSKDVVHHQVRPFEFLSQLLQLPSEALILRTRTRNRGVTVDDPDLSCQFHYKGWMPFIVLNIDELIGAIQNQAPRAEIVVYRNPLVLGGRENRFIPKECYLPETGTAETAVGVFLKSSNPGRITLQDREDMNPAYTLGYRLRSAAHRMLSGFPSGK